VPRDFELGDERRGENDGVARRTREQLVAHRADRTERALHPRARGKAKSLFDRSDDALRGAARQ